jgi:hypothetical protein
MTQCWGMLQVQLLGDAYWIFSTFRNPPKIKGIFSSFRITPFNTIKLVFMTSRRFYDKDAKETDNHLTHVEFLHENPTAHLFKHRLREIFN